MPMKHKMVEVILYKDGTWEIKHIDSRYATQKAFGSDIELLTDTEQRIFLKAIRREREICQKVDDEYSDNDSKVSLVRVCNSIERKVKKIWE